MLGAGKQLDAFSYGSPRRHRIALPRAVAVRWSNRTLFDPLVAHELAHLCNRDVGLSWLTRGVMYAVVPTLALPLVVGAATAEFSLFPDYAWRAAILAATVWMISIALLRSREHDADLRAAILMRDPTAMAALVGRLRPPPQVWWRRLKAHHPTPAARAEVLARPQCAAAVKFLDGLAPAFLAASAIPLVEAVVTALSTANPFGPYQSLVATGIGGVLLGGTVGIGIWRAVAVDRAVSARPSPWVPAAGVAVGLVLGQVASLANTTTGLQGGLDQPAWLIVPALAGLAATALVYSLAEVSADAASRLRSPLWAWLPGVVVASLVYFAALYLSFQLQLALDVGNWAFTRRTLAGELDSWPVNLAMAAAAAMTVVAVVFARHGTPAPAWLFATSTPMRPPWSTASGTARPAAAGRSGLRRVRPRPLRAVSNRHAESPGRDRGNRPARGDDVERRHRRGGGGPCLDGVRSSPWPRALNSRRTGCRVHLHDRVRGDQCRRRRAEEHQASLRRSRRTSSASRSCW